MKENQRNSSVHDVQLAKEKSDIKGEHLEPVQQVYMSLLVCHLDYQMLALVSVA